MKRKAPPPRRSSPKTNGSKKAQLVAKLAPNTAHGRARVAGVKSLRFYMKLLGRGSRGRAGREAFAKRIGTTLPYLQHLVLGNRMASMEMAAKIEAASDGLVLAEELHPSEAWRMLRERAARARAAEGGA